MKFTKIALAAVVTLAAAQAQAATVYLAGASATAANYRAALTSLCSGTATTITNASDSNKFAVKCSVNFTGIPGVDAVSFNVAGGSFTAVTTSVGTDLDVFVDVAAATPTTALTAPRKSEGGFLDIDAAAFPPSALAAAGLSAAPTTTPASFSQVFGVAVSPALYTALQTAQGITGNVDNVSAAGQPSISKAQYASIVSDSFNTAKQDISAILGVGTAGDKLTVCRRVSTSGTQASSNQFFLNAFVGGDGSAAGALAPADATTYGAGSGLDSYEVQEGAGTGNARTCLSAAGYAVGVLSLENAVDLTTRSGGQRADRKYRFVKVNGDVAYDGVNNTTTAKAGQYDFWFTSQKFGATANGTAVVNAIDAKLGTVNLPGLFGNELPDSKAKRLSNTSPVTFN
ncbi:MAG: hypothetical protein RJB60_477 [Pseudomonadota bacterium]|jgi:hypothetical protein